MRSAVREFVVDGIRVEHRPGSGDAAELRPPLLFVHGGCHGSWCWELLMRYFVAREWDCYALNWRNHGGSEALPEAQFIRRGLASVVDDVTVVIEQLGRRPVLVGHSMGGLVSQKYAESRRVEGLVLLAPGFPLQVGRGETVDLPLDMGAPWGPPPPDVANEIFFQGCDPADLGKYYGLLDAESLQCVYEVTRGWLVPVDNVRVSGPVLVLGGDEDRLGNPAMFREVAAYYGGDYEFFFGRGHNLLFDKRWEESARAIDAWLARTYPAVSAPVALDQEEL